jgi:hypothetical protein
MRCPRLLLAAVAASLAFAAPADAQVRPGNQTFVDGAQCTANFLFTDATTGKTFVGSAAHCAADGESTDTNGCEAPLKPLGTRVEIDGAQDPATLAYSSWNAMQANGETDDAACQYNDFALYELSARDAANADPNVPEFGGPQGVGTSASGEDVYTYGNSGLRGGVTLLSPKRGTTVERDPSGWTYTVYTVTPGIPGDSGSGFLNADGAAMGVVSTIALAPLPASNGVTDLGLAMEYARANGVPGLALVNGTEPFTPRVIGPVQ